MKYKSFAIDFDETIFNRKTKELLPHVTRVINKIRECGGEVAIWSCRTGYDRDEMVLILKQNGIGYDCVNDTLPSVRKQFGENGRKIWAEVYIDDLSIHCRNGIDWLEIEKWIWD